MSQEFIRFDSSLAMRPPWGITAEDVSRLSPRLDAARREICEIDILAWQERREIPSEKQPLDTAFVDWPAEMLASYLRDRQSSELGRIIGMAKRLRDQVDRVIVLGIGGSSMGAMAIMQACCQPYFNELSRAERGGRPRLYFEGNNFDNDGLQGLRHLLRTAASAEAIDRSWGLVPISKSGGTLETAVALRLFLRDLESGDSASAEWSDRVIPVCGAQGKLADLATALGCRDRFSVPDGIGGRFSVLTAVGLVPAAILGLDIVAMLRGASDMTEHFRLSPPGSNAVLDYVAVNHLWEIRGATTRVLSIWNKSLEYLGYWYDQLLAESLGKEEQGALPLTTVNTRDLHSRAQQHQEGRRDKIFNHLINEQWRFDPLIVEARAGNPDDLDRHQGRSVPEFMDAATRGTQQALAADRRPQTCLYLPKINEYFLGQFFQMMMLATVVEGRLLGINPYGQPGVEQYKKYMNEILNRRQ